MSAGTAREGREGRAGGAEPSGFAGVRRLMPPHANAGESVDWAAAERTWGTAFPHDYVTFMAEYGEGTISDFLYVLQPLPSPYWTDPDSGMRAETGTARELLTALPRPPGPAPAPDRVIAWGVTSGPDLLCWLTSDPDPDRWPVAVLGRHTPARVTVHDCGMTEFLLRLFLAAFDKCPLSGTRLWGETAPKFLHCREEQRIWDAGIDPWTTAPDPAPPRPGT
ncbi:SMI1/KNR4 family protein [Streptomyces sp. HU2014]|uniref:SMI1/KNR4 family protein n=1 Tax=Streptomyces sp. HU2014 TaxID=2939414 RepID=UPI00200E658A|nr:SMI1/KNR4 family protein [Streptomyces sp. HU2014]UQI45037.1 SMI1/KNR4 family protein [Streptomyces sp. HU2014]